jgi:hypothetical protein
MLFEGLRAHGPQTRFFIEGGHTIVIRNCYMETTGLMNTDAPFIKIRKSPGGATDAFLSFDVFVYDNYFHGLQIDPAAWTVGMARHIDVGGAFNVQAFRNQHRGGVSGVSGNEPTVDNPLVRFRDTVKGSQAHFGTAVSEDRLTHWGSGGIGEGRLITDDTVGNGNFGSRWDGTHYLKIRPTNWPT